MSPLLTLKSTASYVEIIAQSKLMKDTLTGGKKNPGILCTTANRGKGVMLKVSNERCDIQGDAVRIRLEGDPSDLHAAEAR